MGDSRQAFGNSKKLKLVCFALCAMLFALCPSAQAQQPGKIPRIGYLTVPSASAQAPRLEAFRRGLYELGYIEGKNILVEYGFAEGKLDRVPVFAAELARLKVDVIVAAGLTPTRSAKEATHTIPIVMAQDDDPVGNEFVASLARPGGNLTGLSTLSPEISGKQLELLNEIVPNLSRIAVFGTSTRPGNALVLKEAANAAQLLGLELKPLEVHSYSELEKAIEVAKMDRSQAIHFLPSTIFLAERTKITARVENSQLPAMYFDRLFAEAGGLISYGPAFGDLYRQAATYVDKILKGAKPADLPVEQPTKFELVINLKAAQQIGLTIPPNVLARADRVIR
ncbi:MAG: ABC transporter substrate-binding protein [Betaproteobacteria bacterium]